MSREPVNGRAWLADRISAAVAAAEGHSDEPHLRQAYVIGYLLAEADLTSEQAYEVMDRLSRRPSEPA